jgi:hypothetical protein
MTYKNNEWVKNGEYAFLKIKETGITYEIQERVNGGFSLSSKDFTKLLKRKTINVAIKEANGIIEERSL